jgi:protein TonB
MADRKSTSRNAAPPSPFVKFLPIIVIVAVLLIGVALYLFLPHSGNAPAPTTAPVATAPAPGAAAAPAAPAPELSKEQLMKEAGTAFREQRYVAPPGNNALEYYLRVLEKEPTNGTARDALREMFPFATGAVEQEINAGSVDEAARVIDLLAKADPSNYTLTILRGKLDVKRKQTEQQQAQAVAAAAAAANKAAANNAAQSPAATSTATPPPEAAPAAATPTPAAPAAAAASRPPASATPNVTPPPATAAATPPPAASGESHPAELLKTVPPDYPADAYRRHLEGWVEVEFTVTTDGKVSNAAVANANPARVFNDAALRAIQRWSFKPKMENGTAVEDHIKRRIEFKLGG